MLEQGCTYEQIAAEMALRWGFRPRQAWREAYGWTQEDVADRYNQLRGDDQASMTGRRISDYENWPDSGKKPTYKTLSVLAKIYSTSASKLVDHYDRQKMTADERIALEPPRPSVITKDDLSPNGSDRFNQIRPLSTPMFSLYTVVETSTQAQQSSLEAIPSARQIPLGSIRDRIMRAAYESRDHSVNAQGNMMPETTLDEVAAEVRRLNKEHLYSEPLNIFSDIVQVREHIYRFLERRQYPRQTEHLYYLASIVCALLSDISFGVGFPRAALEQARASSAYTQIIGHNSLRVWCRRVEATLASFSNRPQRALDLAVSATEWATEPVAQAGLYNSIALYSAMTARPSEARAALAAAFEAHESAPGDSELFDDFGGLFSLPRARLLQTSTMTFRVLGDLDRAQSDATEAAQLYESGPSELRAFGSEASARIDLGYARLVGAILTGQRRHYDQYLNFPQHDGSTGYV